MWIAKADANRTLTITFPSLTDVGGAVEVYYGQDLTTPLDGTPVVYYDTAAGTSHVTGNLGVSGASGILSALWAQEEIGRTHSGANSWVLLTEEADHVHASLDKAYSGSGNYTASLTSSGATAYMCIFAAFKAAAGAGVTGTLAGTLGQVTGAVAGVHGVAGTAAGTLGSVTGAIAGRVRVEGTIARTLGNITGAFSGAHGVAGSMAGTLATATGVFSGAHGVAGAEAATLAPVTGSVAGSHGVAGTINGSLAKVTGTFSGTVSEQGEVTGSLTATLTNVTGSISGAPGVAGTASGTLKNITGAMTGQVRAEGPLTGTLGNTTGSFTGTHGVAGSVAGTLATATGVFSGAHGVGGTALGTLSGLTGNLTGTVQAEGNLIGTLAPITGAFAGTISGVVTGTLAGTLQPITGSIAGQVGPDTADSWKFPASFSENGFTYGDYDPGQAAAIAIGCLHIYMKTGDERAGTWARRILDDLRVNRRDQDYGGYKSDRHYGWLNALVLQTFGLGVNGVPGQSYRFPAITEDKAHFDALISWIMARAGDEKPNVLNSDLIPFTFSEAGDMWELCSPLSRHGPDGQPGGSGSHAGWGPGVRQDPGRLGLV